MKIMITGGAGFVGSHLCDKLIDDGHKIIVLTKNYSKINNITHLKRKIKVEKVDVTNFIKLGKSIEKNKPNVIIHLAGQTSHSRSFENPLYDVDVNTKSTLFILEKIRKIKLQCRFLLGSSFIVVGKSNKLPINEESTCNPNTIYGVDRLTSEYFCKLYHHVYGLDTLIFRITNSFGPREQHVAGKNAINFLIYKAFKGEDITLYFKGKFFRDLIYISDVVSGIETIMKNGKPGNLYWISSAKKTWFYQFGNILEKITGSNVKYVNTPQYTKKVDVGNFIVKNSKLRKLGWKPKVSVKEGIQKTLEYFQSLPN